MAAMPDAELMAVTHLTARLPGMYVSSDVPEPDIFDQLMAAKDAIVTVIRVGGDPSLRNWAAETVIDAPRLSIDVRGRDRQAANTAAGLVREAAEAMHGVSVSGGRCKSIDVGGPTLRPEELNTSVVRLGFFADMRTTPAPA